MSCRYGLPTWESQSPYQYRGCGAVDTNVMGYAVQGEEIAEIFRTRWGSSSIRGSFRTGRGETYLVVRPCGCSRHTAYMCQRSVTLTATAVRPGYSMSKFFP